MPGEGIALAVPGRERPVSAVLQLPGDASALLVLAHGAGAGMRHRFLESLASSLEERGIGTLRYQFPSMEEGRSRTDPPAVATATVRAAVELARARAGGVPLFAGGKSFGGRMTTTAAAEAPLPGVVGIVLFGFPLHPAGRPGLDRAAHLRRVTVPMLFFQGTRDALADLDLVREVVTGLGPRSGIRVVEEADHSFHVPKRAGRTDLQVIKDLAAGFAEWALGRL
jgi:predicted alpha/beta-hydrolase family hydrolase